MRLLRSAFILLLSAMVFTSGAIILISILPGPASEPPPRRTGPYPVPEGPSGPLSDLVVYISAGHGYLLHRVHHDGEPFAWGRQRRRRYGMVEDEWTADFVAQHLAPAIEAAGGTVLALRERDPNPISTVSDDAHWSSYAFEAAVRVQDELAYDKSYLRLEPNGSAAWWLQVPEAGHWYLYARWVDHELHDGRAIYTVNVGGDVREVVVDQRAHGGHWWPLGDFCLPEGETVEVALTGSGDGMLSADAIRIGGGTFVIAPEFDYKVREHRMYDVAMPHQIEHLGAPEALATYECGTPVSDARLRPHWASWASPEGENAVYLSIHTNAARGRAQGLTVFAGIDRAQNMSAKPESVRLAQLLEQSIYGHVRAHDGRYQNRGTRPGDYSEISPAHNTLPGALLELGFHDHREEAKRLQTERFQKDAAAGIVEALERWNRGQRAYRDGADEG